MKSEKNILFSFLPSRLRAFMLSAFCLFLFASPLLPAQPLITTEYNYRHYTTQDGLPQMRCNAIFQDSKGFIWIGTESGFSRYNGLEFQSFFPEKNLNIFKFYEDENGNVVATGNYHHYRVLFNDKIEKFTPKQGLYFHEFYSMNLPSNYGVYVDFNNEQRGVYRVVHDTLQLVFKHPVLNQMGQTDFCFVYFDEVENLWYAPTGREGLYVIDQQGNILEKHNHYFETVVRFNNTIYAADYCNEGLFKKTKKGFEKVCNHKFVGNVNFIPLNDTILIIKCSNHIYRYLAHSDKLEIVFSPVGINLSIRNIMLDNEGNLWAATRTGVYNLYKLLFRKYTVNYGIREKNIITSLAETPQNTYYFGTIHSDLIKLSPNQSTKNINITSPHIWAEVKSFMDGACVYKNDIYVASNLQLLRVRNDKPQFLTQGDIFARAVFHINGDTLGVTSAYGFYLYNTEGKQLKFYSKEVLKQRGLAIWSLAVDKKGQIVVAGELGLSIIKGNDIELKNDTILFDSEGVTRDENGTVWIIAENRLCTWDGENIKLVYTFSERLLRCVKVVRENYLVVATTQGFSLFDLREYYAGKPMQICNYDQFNGFMGIEPLRNSIFEDSHGDVWLMSQNGVFRFNPEQLIQKQLPPRLQILNFSFSSDNVKWENSEFQPKISIKYFNNSVRFSYIGLSYSATNHVRYYYRLNGFQNEWSEPTKQREITFNNLPPGNYVFEIYADAGTNESRSEIQTFTFSIKPAFWQTAWFFIVCIVFLILIVTGTALRIQRRKNKILLENLGTEKELNDLSISSIRLKAIPHFNANVLAAIEYSIANRTKEEAMRILGTYSNFTYKTLSEVDKAARTLSDELDYVKMYLDLEKVRFINKFDFIINVDENVNNKVLLPNMILHTYCENAIKHGLMPLKSGGLLSITVTQQNNNVSVSIEDNGVGRAAAGQNLHIHSSKQGLSILNRQIEIYNRFNREKITQQIDDLAPGTRFTVVVPVGFSYGG